MRTRQHGKFGRYHVFTSVYDKHWLMLPISQGYFFGNMDNFFKTHAVMWLSFWRHIFSKSGLGAPFTVSGYLSLSEYHLILPKARCYASRNMIRKLSKQQRSMLAERETGLARLTLNRSMSCTLLNELEYLTGYQVITACHISILVRSRFMFFASSFNPHPQTTQQNCVT
jgi:hypothetical protein